MPRPRHPVTFWALAFLYAFFCAFGVLVIVTGTNAGARVIGVMILLLFGLGGFGHLSGPALTRRGAHTVRRDYVETSAGSEPAFVFPCPRMKRRASAIGLAGSAVAIVGMLAVTGGGAFVIAGTVLLCAVAVWAVVALRRPQFVALTPTRVLVVLPGGAVEVPWTAGVDAEIYPMPTGQANVDMVGLVAADGAAAIWTRGRVIGAVNAHASRYVVSVPADSFAGEGEDVVTAIRRYAGDAAARRRIGDEAERELLLRLLGETPPQVVVNGIPAA